MFRQPYVTTIVRDVALPATLLSTLDGAELRDETQVWIGGFGVDFLGEQTVWWRLFQSDFPGDKRVVKTFIYPAVSTRNIETILDATAPSEHSRCCLIEDPNAFWNELIVPRRGFAAIIEAGKIPLLMIGPPTEDAWEEFSDAWMTRT